MASIKQVKIGSTSYDIKATYDGSGNTITSTYLSKTATSAQTMAGTLTTVNPASTATSNTTAGVRNISYGTAAPSGGNNGDIYIQYS